MPLPPYLISVSLLVCERVLREMDGVLSAIRVVDIFYVPQKPPEIPAEMLPMVQAYAFASLWAIAGYQGKHSLRARLINTVGESSTIVELDTPFRIKEGAETAPPGLSVMVQLNLGVKRFGTCYICVDLDGEEVARTPITLMQRQAEIKAS